VCSKIAKWLKSEFIGVVFPILPIHHFAQFSCRINKKHGSESRPEQKGERGVTRATKGNNAGARPNGFALIVVTWIIALLMIIALSFSSLAKTGTRGAMVFKESIEKRYLAEAGIQRAVVELYYRKTIKDPKAVLEFEDAVKIDGRPYTFGLGNGGNGQYTFRITDESGKININNLTDASAVVFNNLLRNAGSSEDEANTIVDSILDWKDADDLHRLHGAENDYYLSLPNPYKPRNAKFEALEELMLVKGMTSDILFGNDKRQGIIRFLTVHSTSSTININFAPREVLMAIPNMPAALAEAVLSQRGQEAGKESGEMSMIIGDAFKEMSAYAGVAPESNTFTVEAIGHKGGEKKGFTITAVITLSSNNKYKYLYYKCPSGNGQ
jgi:general secretion pathway protein K